MIIIGHRGAKGLAPENTLAAVKTALNLGVDEIEINVRVTKDSVVILNHDPFIPGHLGQEFWITHHTYSELKEHKPDLATLDEVIKLVRRKKTLLVEVKPDVNIEPIVKLVRQYLNKGWKSSDFLLGSFSKETLLDLNSSLPQVQKVVNERWSGIRAVRRARAIGTKRLSMNQQVLWSGYIRMMSRRGFQIYAYPLNDPGRARKWADKGLFGTITDFPDRFTKGRHKISE